MKTLRGRLYSFKQLTQFTMLNKVLDSLASNINDSLTRGIVLLPIPSKGLFGTKLMFLTLSNADRYAVFLLHTNSVLTCHEGANFSCL
jgi:hypothetical protein